MALLGSGGRSRRRFVEELERCYGRYKREVEATSLRDASKRTYLLHSWNFVRWVKGDFEPGANVS